MAQESSPPRRWWVRAVRVGFLSFTLAVAISYIADVTLSRVPALLSMLGVGLLILINIVFDIIGTAVTAAETPPLHAMAAKRVAGSKQALFLVRNADRVANFLNDVVGDVTGAVSGAAGATVAMQLVNAFHGGELAHQLTSLAVIGLISFFTVGGKAAGKSFAMEHPIDVVFLAGRVIHATEQVTGRSFTGGRSPRRRSP